MKRVKFKTVGHLAQMAGVKELDIELEGSTIRDFLIEVFKQTDESYGKFVFPRESLNDVVTILQNGKNIKLLDGLDTPLEDGDVVNVMHMNVGG
ncbi:MAG TPA: MoaD/ThiS family protein [Methanomassiliicoccales archaeon]|nr:MoaD/ThiS family protein [Methanomassiliicoccales archaeon]